MEKEKLLIVEDDAELDTQMKWGLGKEYQIFQAEDHASALKSLKDSVPGRHPGPGSSAKPDSTEEGFRTLVDILAHDPLTKVIVITGHHEKEHALAAIGNGADF